MNKWTYGSEIEAADWDTRVELPEGSTLDMKDYTIANSNGLGNDNKKILNVFGGEVNTKVTKSVDDQVDVIMDVYSAITPYSFNYTCNFHIHIGLEGLTDDLEKMKKINHYIYKYQDMLFDDILPPIPEPDKSDKPAYRRFKKRQRSHRRRISPRMYKERMEATTVEEFFAVNRIWKQRPGVNINALEKHGTVEFRHFPPTDDPEVIRDCIIWCQSFLTCALDTPEITPRQLWDILEPKFPEFKPFDHKIDEVFQKTQLDHEYNSRKDVEAYYKENGYEDLGIMCSIS